MTGMSPVVGSMGVICALLSRTPVMTGRAKLGMLLSIVSSLVFILIMGIFFYILFTTGTWQQIIHDLANVDPNSANAPSDVMNIIQQNIINLYQNLLNGANVPAAGPVGI
ncbi:MAG: hypothetical protein KBS83_00620 [Lachnospiraceae bacterium]|nr:hypothetical protein [Candidatus Equihabitans merdae]